jgi:DNA-binding NtrC family response regulator
MTAAAERALQQAEWPGNIRELRNVMERACLLTDGKMLSERDVLAAMPPRTDPTYSQISRETEALNLSETATDPNLLTSAQRSQIARVLREARGNKTVAARTLGISRRSLYRWLDRLDVPEPSRD